MKKTHIHKKLLLSLTLSLAAASAAHANLVVNGDFETHTAFNGDNWNYFGGTYGGSVTGWSSGSSDIPLEVGLDSVYGVTGASGAVMELDTTVNVVATQPLATTAGASYTLSFLYALRAGVASTSGTLDVYWNGIKLDSLTPLSSAMALYSKTVIGTGSDILKFVGTGDSDSYGALIDNVSVVPEPSTYVAGALLLLPFAASTLRTLRKSRNA